MVRGTQTPAFHPLCNQPEKENELRFGSSQEGKLLELNTNENLSALLLTKLKRDVVCIHGMIV